MPQNRHTLKILQQLLQDFLSVSDHFGTLGIKGLKKSYKVTKVKRMLLQIFFSYTGIY